MKRPKVCALRLARPQPAPGLQSLETRQLLSATSPLEDGAAAAASSNADGSFVQQLFAADVDDTGRKARPAAEVAPGQLAVGVLGVSVGNGVIGEFDDNQPNFSLSFDNRDFVVFEDVDFSTGLDRILMNLSSNSQNGNERIQIRLDAPDGRFLGSVTPSQTVTGSADFEARLQASVAGVHDLYLVAAGGNDVATLNRIVISGDGMDGTANLVSPDTPRTPSLPLTRESGEGQSGDDNAVTVVATLTADDVAVSGNLNDTEAADTLTTSGGLIGGFTDADFARFDDVDAGFGVDTLTLEFVAVPFDQTSTALDFVQIRTSLEGGSEAILATVNTADDPGDTDSPTLTFELSERLLGETLLFLIAGGDALPDLRSITLTRLGPGTAPVDPDVVPRGVLLNTSNEDFFGSAGVADAGGVASITERGGSFTDIQSGDFIAFAPLNVSLFPDESQNVANLELDGVLAADQAYELRTGAASGAGSSLLATFTDTGSRSLTATLNPAISGEQSFFLVATGSSTTDLPDVAFIDFLGSDSTI